MQRRILIVRTDRVGDVVMMTPLIRELRRTFPDAFIATLTNENSADILINNPNIDVCLTDDLRKNTFRNVVNKIKSFGFTDGLLLMPTERAAWQMFLGGIKNRIGVGKKLYEVITFMKSVSRNKYIPLRHEADYCMDLGRAIGVESSDLTPEIFLTGDEITAGKNLISDEGIKNGHKKIIVHTGSGNSSRNWSEKKYLELIKKIPDIVENSSVILTAKEMTTGLRIEINKIPGSKYLIVDNKIKKLRDLICLISAADVLIASSTGPLHIASALKVKTIGLFCHRRMNCAKHWGALGNKAVNLEVSKEYCDKNCSSDKEECNFENGISIDEVIYNLKKTF